MKQHDVTVSVDGLMLPVREDFLFTVDMLAPGSTWTTSFAYTDQSPDDWKLMLRRALIGVPVEVRIDDVLQVRGKIEVRQLHVSRERGALLILSGRDLAAPAIDWDADPSLQLHHTMVDQALRMLFKPLNIPVFVNAPALAIRDSMQVKGKRDLTQTKTPQEVIERLKIRPGEHVWAVAERLAAQAGCLLWTGPFASGVGVVLDRPAYDQPARGVIERIREGDAWRGNVLSSEDIATIRGIATHVSSLSHAAMSTGEDARVCSVVPNNYVLESSKVSRSNQPYQPRFLNEERARSPKHATSAAQRLFARDNIKFRSYTATVAGFSQHVEGKDVVYTVNAMMRVRDELDEPACNEPMLCTRVHMQQEKRSGQRTTLSLSPIGAIRID